MPPLGWSASANQFDFRSSAAGERRPGDGDRAGRAGEGQLVDPAAQVPVAVARRHVQGGEGADDRIGGLNGRVGERRRPVVIRVADRPADADGVAGVDHGGELRPGRVATRGGRVLGGGHRGRAVDDHDLPGRVLRGQDRQRGLVLHARVALAGLVTGVGVAAVAQRVRLDIGAGGHGLGLGLLEAPVLALGPGPAEGAPRRGRLRRRDIGHVLLEGEGVDRTGLPVDVATALSDPCISMLGPGWHRSTGPPFVATAVGSVMEVPVSCQPPWPAQPPLTYTS